MPLEHSHPADREVPERDAVATEGVIDKATSGMQPTLGIWQVGQIVCNCECLLATNLGKALQSGLRRF